MQGQCISLPQINSCYCFQQNIQGHANDILSRCFSLLTFQVFVGLRNCYVLFVMIYCLFSICKVRKKKENISINLLGNVFISSHVLTQWTHLHSFSNRSRYSTQKIRRYYIDFGMEIHVEIMTSIQCWNFNVDLTFKINKISMRSSGGFFYVLLMRKTFF